MKIASWTDTEAATIDGETPTALYADGRVVTFKSGAQVLADLRKRGMTAETARIQKAADRRFNPTDQARKYREWIAARDAQQALAAE